MKKCSVISILLLCISPVVYAWQPNTGKTTGQVLKNEAYEIAVRKDGSFTLSNTDGAKSVFSPSFTIVFRSENPTLKYTRDKSINFIVPVWKQLAKDTTTVAFYEAGENIRIQASGYTIDNGVLTWQFPEHAQFTLQATLTLLEGRQEPRINFTFSPKKEGWYSVGFTGSPAISPAKAESIWQPLIWQELRFPKTTYLSLEHMCPVPAVMVGQKGVITGVIADPAEVPFRLPVFDNARFGLLVRNPKGHAQPQLFAPVFGHQTSQMKGGDRFSFSLRLLARKGDWLSAYQHIARNLYLFRDYRQNGTASLNETIENMIDYALNDQYSGWNKELKAFDYATDVKGTVKLVSALHPLSMALVTDNPEIYRQRALPMTEYLMSRQKYLFSMDEGTKGQNAAHAMKGPAAEVSELAALFSVSQGRSPVFSHYAEYLFDKPRALNLLMVSEGGSWQNALALYRLTRDQKYLDKAVSGATDYLKKRVATPQKDFSDAHIEDHAGGQFWTDFSPKWIDLLELYEETKDKRFLDAAVYGARIYTSYVWLQPSVPAGDVVINENVTLGMGDAHNKKKPVPMSAPTLRVPAWRVSQIGLTPEASNTYQYNPAVFLTHYAAYMLRLAHYTGDAFLKDVARSAVVGRYTNYPGYDINHEYTTLYQRPDYPLRECKELTYNQIYYNHVWPHITLLTDYLITDAIYKSVGKINFPSQYAMGYAYLQSKVYGDRTGEFYGEKGVRLWMPKKLLRTDNIQINYVAGHGNGKLYLALLNQSAADERVKLVLNPDMVPVEWGKTYKVCVWQGDQKTEALLKGGGISLDVKAHGLTAIAIENLPVMTRFQEKVFDTSVKPLSSKSHAETPTPFGTMTGMLLSMGKDLTSGYVWLEADEKVLKGVKLHYKTAQAEQEMTDTRYPFEFSLPLEENDQILEYWVEGETTAGEKVQSGKVQLKR